MRTYHFNPADRTGVVMGLDGTQVIAFGSGLLGMVFLFTINLPIYISPFPLIVALIFCFTPVGPIKAYEWVPIGKNWIKKATSGKLKWHSPLPSMAAGKILDTAPILPPSLEGLEILEVDAAWARKGGRHKVAVVKDNKGFLMTAIIPVSGREFALVDRSEQERLIDAWGEALAPFCRERSAITRVSWTEWAAPSGVDDHRLYLDEACRAPSDSPALHAYLDLLEVAGPMVTTHEVLVTVSVDWRKVRPSRKSGEDSVAVATRQVVEEVRMLSGRLEAAHLHVGEPLTVADLARTLRMRIDPADSLRLNQRQRVLPKDSTVVSKHNLAPLTVEEKWRFVRVDGAYHRCYWIYEWPRLEVPGDWMSSLLLSTSGVRTVAMHYEPVAMSRSQRAISRESTKLAADMQTKEKHGFRIGADYGRAQKAVLDREQEIVAGYTEFEYTGLMIVSAETEEDLEENCSEYEQTVASVGVDIRPLDGRHADAWVAALPVGRGLAGKMTTW